MEDSGARQQQEIVEIQSDIENVDVGSSFSPNSSSPIVFSGDVGVAFFSGEKNSEFPNKEFRIDDARLNVEAELAENTYLVSTLELYRRESGNQAMELGPVYIDFENVFRLSDYDRLFNLRVGRFDIPFGHEYLNRYVMENPLISHSVADLWGIDEGIEMYGSEGDFSYVLAIQNGGTSQLRDFDSDKSLTAKVGYDLFEGLNVSASFMDTGNLDAAGDRLSEIWIGNVVFLSIGSPQTSKFSADLFQLDFDYNWGSGNLIGSFGEATYVDNDPLGDNTRDFEFYSIEARQNLNDQWFASARYSTMDVVGGYPIAGNGARSIYLFGGALTERLERLSLGFGYWVFEDVVVKLEYTKEDGRLSSGWKRQHTDQVSAELGVRF